MPFPPVDAKRGCSDASTVAQERKDTLKKPTRREEDRTKHKASDVAESLPHPSCEDLAELKRHLVEEREALEGCHVSVDAQKLYKRETNEVDKTIKSYNQRFTYPQRQRAEEHMEPFLQTRSAARQRSSQTKRRVGIRSGAAHNRDKLCEDQDEPTAVQSRNVAERANAYIDEHERLSQVDSTVIDNVDVNCDNGSENYRHPVDQEMDPRASSPQASPDLDREQKTDEPVTESRYATQDWTRRRLPGSGQHIIVEMPCINCLREYLDNAILFHPKSNPLVAGLAMDVHTAKAVITSIVTASSPALPPSAQDYLSKEWQGIAEVFWTLSTKGPGSLYITNPLWMKKTADDLANDTGFREIQRMADKRQEHITKILLGSQSQSTSAASHPNSSGSVWQAELFSRKALSRLIPTDPGYPLWRATVEKYLTELGDFCLRYFSHLPTEYTLLCEQMSVGLHLDIPARFTGPAPC
ncbi:hypothetical protein SLS53_007395 [Cytospora paraplurivora]|uniref:Uncharacterized protein n=1 Tax=Cytospora paraplurivora TaxID=2898453 RepID=A0AAN9U0A1_9PEZI